MPAFSILLKHPFNICCCLCFSLLIPLGVQSNNQTQTDRQASQRQWQLLFASLILTPSPATTLSICQLFPSPSVTLLFQYTLFVSPPTAIQCF